MSDDARSEVRTFTQDTAAQEPTIWPISEVRPTSHAVQKTFISRAPLTLEGQVELVRALENMGVHLKDAGKTEANKHVPPEISVEMVGYDVPEGGIGEQLGDDFFQRLLNGLSKQRRQGEDPRGDVITTEQAEEDQKYRLAIEEYIRRGGVLVMVRKNKADDHWIEILKEQVRVCEGSVVLAQHALEEAGKGIASHNKSVDPQLEQLRAAQTLLQTATASESFGFYALSPEIANDVDNFNAAMDALAEELPFYQLRYNLMLAGQTIAKNDRNIALGLFLASGALAGAELLPLQRGVAEVFASVFGETSQNAVIGLFERHAQEKTAEEAARLATETMEETQAVEEMIGILGTNLQNLSPEEQQVLLGFAQRAEMINPVVAALLVASIGVGVAGESLAKFAPVAAINAMIMTGYKLVMRTLRFGHNARQLSQGEIDVLLKHVPEAMKGFFAKHPALLRAYDGLLSPGSLGRVSLTGSVAASLVVLLLAVSGSMVPLGVSLWLAGAGVETAYMAANFADKSDRRVYDIFLKQFTPRGGPLWQLRPDNGTSAVNSP